MQLESTELAQAIVDIMDDRQAADIVLLDIRPVSLISDYFVIATGETKRQLSALADTIRDTVRTTSGIKPLAVEGAADSGWIILDYSGVVAHLFGPEERDYYKLDQLWEEGTLIVRIK
ncbi:MAG: ribosome silencing factor [Anaerolineae bacterium]